MTRFNTPAHKAKAAVTLATSPLSTVSMTSDTLTFNGAEGFTRTAQTELFLRAAGAVDAGAGTFYESADKRDDRLRELTRWVAVNDPDWGYQFASWLRGPGNIRTGALMFAVEFVHERLAAGMHGSMAARVGDPAVAWTVPSNRSIIDIVCQRADEPGEILAIWTAWYGRKIPKPVKRGVADAAARLYTQRSLLKYDTASHGYRFGDVLNLVHTTPINGEAKQGELFKYALDRRHNPATAQIPNSLGVLKANADFQRRVSANPSLLTDPAELYAAAMTWENALSLAGKHGVAKRTVWEAMIPSMGIMALIRNLRNFDEAGVSDAVAAKIITRLTDADEIARSRQFPFRFLSAYRATQKSLRWAYPLERALNLSLVNVPRLGGRTLILVDRSPSMFPGTWGSAPNTSDISLADQAAVFGSALAVRAENPTLVEFGGKSRVIDVPPAVSVLKLVEEFGQDGGTDIPSAIKKHYDKHDRVIVVTDEQTSPGYFPSNMHGYGYGGMRPTLINDLVPKDVPVYMWNLAGYTPAAMPSGNEARFTMGGLTDAAFRLVPRLEAGVSGEWPWQTEINV